MRPDYPRVGHPDIDMAYAWADDVVILRDGQVVSHGVPEIVLRDKAALEQCQLRMPFVLETALRLVQAGIVERAGALPRTREELFRVMSEASISLKR